MPSKLLLVSLWLSATIVLGGCGDSPTITCQTTMCSGGAKTYQVCSHTDGSVSNTFGGASCSCDPNDQQACEQCAMQVAAYCGGGAGGTGGSGAGGTGGSGGAVTCTATFSGAVSGTITGCVATITHVGAGNVTTLAITGDALSGTPYMWTGFDMTLTGPASTGTFDQTAALGATTEVTQSGAQNPALWVAGHGNDQTFGSLSVTVTSLGIDTNVSGNDLYAQPHGTVTATLQDQNPSTAQPSIMLAVRF